MPFKSVAQRNYMFSQHPEIAKRWSAEFPNQGKLPARVNTRKERQAAVRRVTGG